MTQKSLHWDGATLGDADALVENAADGIGYRLGNEDYESPMVDLMFRALWNGDENRGVLKGWGNELVVTGAVSPVTVGTGGAIVYGMPYENTTTPVNVAIPSPTTDTRIDRIVLRRDWAAQEIRVTRIVGIEGGGAPAITQSPAPDGSGIYDIPLAQCSITTGGAITVTDEREFVLFGTGIADDAFGTTQLNNDSIDWADRATTTKRLFIGGGALRPMLAAGRFTYTVVGSILMAGAPAWGGAANEQAWRHTGTSHRGVIGTFQTPPDYASGDLQLYIWWVNNALVAASFYVRGYVQARDKIWINISSIYSSDYIDDSGAVSDVFRTEGPTIESGDVDDNDGPGGIWNVWAGIYNTAGVEDIGIMGIEVEYTGYV